MEIYRWDLLEELCAVHAVSGREDLMTSKIYNLISPLVDESFIDNLGNVVGILYGERFPGYRLMLQAHMDEVGFIIRDITKDGFLLFERVGGIPEYSLLGEHVDVLTESGQIIPGYIGTKSHHVTVQEERYMVPKIHDMFIDVGFTTRKEVEEAGIRIGDTATYHPNFNRFGNGMICSKALDNRVGVFILLEILNAFRNQRPPSTLVFSFTVLEEFSVRGSLPTVTATKPNAIISIDITVATDTPLERPLHPVSMRNGPAVKMMDFHGRGTLGGLFSSPKLRRFIEKIAAENNIPLQREVIIGVITDPAFQLYLNDKGYIIAGISIPQRYTHSSIQMCHELDIVWTIRLLHAVAQSFTPEIDLSRGI